MYVYTYVRMYLHVRVRVWVRVWVWMHVECDTHKDTHTGAVRPNTGAERTPLGVGGWGGGGLRETKFVEHGHGVAPRPGADGGPGLPERPCVAVYAVHLYSLYLARSRAPAHSLSRLRH